MSTKKLGPYDIQSVLGRGGMGTVYRAVDTQSGQTVAVKALAPTLSLDEHFRQRFESEIETMTKMDHPNIVRILGFGQDEGNLYFAMELVEGKSLFMLQKEGVIFDWRQVLRISLDICAGLQHAHNRGIIHRDLKPGNLIRENTGNVKITDFGIAKSFGASPLTGEGSVLGTMDFMAPEQAQTGKVTPRSDLYSLGAVMYSLLSRRPPLKSQTLEETLRNLTTVKPENIRKLVPNVPPDFAVVIHRLLEKDPQKRFATSLALSKYLLDLQSFLKDTSEAKTESVTDQSATREVTQGQKTHDDFSLSPSLSRQTDTGFEIVGGTQDKSLGGTEAADSPTRVVTEEEPLLAAPPDFYATVPRTKSPIDGEPPARSSGVLWIALALVAVLGILAVGVYWATRRPSAEQLLALIDEGAAQPTRVQESIDQFLLYYPDHERVAEVKQWDEIASAIRFRAEIMRRSRISGAAGLKTIEREFLDVTDFDSPGDFRKLQAMITLNEAIDDLDSTSTRILAAARAYSTKFRLDVERDASQGRMRIQNALESCDKADSETARNICESIIELYGNQAWANDLVGEAKRRLQQLPNSN